MHLDNRRSIYSAVHYFVLGLVGSCLQNEIFSHLSFHSFSAYQAPTTGSLIADEVLVFTEFTAQLRYKSTNSCLQCRVMSTEGSIGCLHKNMEVVPNSVSLKG